jgi:hypothetical protein
MRGKIFLSVAFFLFFYLFLNENKTKHIVPKMQNQPVFPAKFGTLERLDDNLSTTADMNMICSRILLRI